MKIYAVKKGRVPGVYRNWDETKKQVDGFSGAEYKSFENITDAIDYLGWQEKSYDHQVSRSRANRSRFWQRFPTSDFLG